MIEIVLSAIIRAPMKRVFRILDDPRAVPLYAPAVSEVDVIRRSKNRIGDVLMIDYKFAGRNFRTKFVTMEYIEPRYIRVSARGTHFNGDMIYILEKRSKNVTKLINTASYTYGVRPNGDLIGSFVFKQMLKSQLETSVKNIKKMSEIGFIEKNSL